MPLVEPSTWWSVHSLTVFLRPGGAGGALVLTGGLGRSRLRGCWGLIFFERGVGLWQQGLLFCLLYAHDK